MAVYAEGTFGFVMCRPAMAKFVKALLTVLGCVVVLVAVAYVFRVGLLRAGINAVLTGDTTVTRLQGVQLGSAHAEIADVELSLGPGQQFVVSGITVDFMMQGLFRVPLVQNLTIASARLTDTSREQGNVINSDDDAAAPPPVENSAVQQTGLLLSELLQQLREFPLLRMELEELQLPQFRQTLALHVAQQDDALQVQFTTGGLELLAGFSQNNADAVGQFKLTLQADAQILAEMQVSLTPQPSGYQLAGNGSITIPDANVTFAEYLTRPLPIADIAVEWDVAATVNDDLLGDQDSVINVGIAPASSFTLSEGITANLGALAVVIPARAELSVTPGAMNVAGQLPLQLNGSWQQQALEIQLLLTPTDCRISDALDCRIGFDGAANLAALIVAGADPAAPTTINALEFSGSGAVHIDDEVVDFSIAMGSALNSAMIAGTAFAVGAVAAVATDTVTVTTRLADSPIVIAGEEVAVTLTDFSSGEYSASGAMALHAIDLTIAEQSKGTLNLRTAGLAVSGPQWIPAVGIDADLGIDGDVLTFSTPLQLHNGDAQMQLQTDGSYDLAAGAGQFRVQLPPLTLTGEGNSLSSYLAGWPYEADVMSGTLALDVSVEMKPAAADAKQAGTAITANTKLAVTDVAGFYMENFFRGLNTTIDATYDSSSASLPVTIPQSTVMLDELNVGLPITGIAIDYELSADNQIVNVNSIFARALDGTISGMNISYDFTKELNEFNLSFASLRLERMLELAEYEGIEASGAMSGDLPITVREGQIEIDAGRLFAEAPGGSIRYLNAPPAGGNPAMDLVNQALSNYQFQSLESAIDYTPDGELLLAMQLRGNNPDMNGGQAINLNLNISDNIPTLLKSLRAGRAIEDFLQEQYK